jgi:hypothetical protein
LVFFFSLDLLLVLLLVLLLSLDLDFLSLDLEDLLFGERDIDLERELERDLLLLERDERDDLE